jgi:transcription antitermination factor NusG
MGIRRTYWAALETDYQSEGTASRSLQGIAPETYNPLYRERRRNGVRRVLPLLQGYLLVRIDRRGTDLGDVLRAKGVRSFLRGAGDRESAPPCVIQDSKIEWIRGLEGSDGYVVLEGEEPPAFAFGDHVLAASGAMRDQRGEYRGLDQGNSRRAVVAFEILGRVVTSSIPRYDLARA